MFSKSTFHFHKFENDNSPSSFYDTKNSNTNVFNSTKIINEQNVNNTYRSLNYETQKYKSNDGYKTFRESNIHNLRNTKNNRQLNINNSPFNENDEFPEKEILKMKTFDYIINYGDISKIEKVLPQMVYGKYNKESSAYFNLLIKNFQLILQYLFKYNDDIKEYNYNLDNTLNDSNSEINQLTKRLKYEISFNENLININEKREKKYLNKLNNYKNNLILKGIDTTKAKKKFPLDIHDDDGFFYCDNCPNKKFTSYEKIYEHYIKKHSNSGKMNLGNLIFQNSNFQKYYFDNELNKLRKNLSSSIYEIYRKNNEEREKLEIEKLDNEIMKISKLNNEINNNNNNTLLKTKNTSIKISSLRKSLIDPTKSVITVNNQEANNKLNDLISKQKKNFTSFQKVFVKFQNDILNQLKNFSEGKPIIIPKKGDKLIINKTNYQEIGNVYMNDTNNIQNTELKNSNINYKTNDVIEKGTNLLNQNKNGDSQKIFAEIIEEPDENNSQNEKKLRGNKYPNFNNGDEISENNDLYNRFKKRENNCLFNHKYNTIEETLKTYNFLNLNPNDDDKLEIKNLIQENFNDYNNFNVENKKLLSKDYYKDIINRICIKNKEESENDYRFEKYKNNLLQKIDIYKLVENFPDIKDIIYMEEENNEEY